MEPAWIEFAKAVAPLGAASTLLGFAAWLLYRYAQGKFISEREWLAAQQRETRLEEKLLKEQDAHQETRDALRETLAQNGMLIQASTISTEVMRRLDQRAQEGGGTG